MPGLIKIFLHLEDLRKIFDDVSKLISDIKGKNNVVVDLQKIATDIKNIYNDGFLPPPTGMTLEQVNASLDVLASLKF